MIDCGLLAIANAKERRSAAVDFIVAHRDGVCIVAPDRDVASELLAEAARRCAGMVAGTRWTLRGLAEDLASMQLAALGLSPASEAVFEALCARVLTECRAGLGRLENVASLSGMPRALASTLRELGWADLSPKDVTEHAPELAVLYSRLQEELDAGKLVEESRLYELAQRALRERRGLLRQRAILFLDPWVRGQIDADFLSSVANAADSYLVLIPAGDSQTASRLGAMTRLASPGTDRETRALERIQESLFLEAGQVRSGKDPSFDFLVAANERTECEEIARSILEHARQGTALDSIAVLLRSPELYRGPLTDALERASIPHRAMRGARAPDPHGRAFLALLACAAEDCSASRFAEYLSFAVVPDAPSAEPPPPLTERARYIEAAEVDQEGETTSNLEPAPLEAYDPEAVVRAGTLRTPRAFEREIVSALVVSGPARWRRRLEGSITAARRELDELRDPESGQALAIARRIDELNALRTFALPVIDTLAAFPSRAKWSVWLDIFGALATRTLRDPRRVLSIFAGLAPFRIESPVSLAEVRVVLTALLSEAPSVPLEPLDPVARVFVGTVDEARGRSFDVVFVPGMTEKVFPPPLTRDPLLDDRARAQLGLSTAVERAGEERRRLHLAVGAACTRLVVSHSESSSSRSIRRVPSFYVLELVRAAWGGALGDDVLAAARQEALARGPLEPTRAIDDREYDLALIARIFRMSPAERGGRLGYLASQSPIALRALRARWAKWDRKAWRAQDGLVEPGSEARAILNEHTLSERPFSATALETFASCPYRFYLRTIARLEPRKDPTPIETLDAAQRGTMMHDIQFELLTRLRTENRLPLDAGGLEVALALLDEATQKVRDFTAEELAPAIPRVFDDAVESIRRDLREWVTRLGEDASWLPRYFELAFGLSDSKIRDEHSRPDPVALPIGLSLRGSIDLVEQRDNVLRATDHKSGSAYGIKQGLRVHGGEKLQPILYAMALEELFPAFEISGGRLYYCTSKGGYQQAEVSLNEDARRAMEAIVRLVDEHVRSGFLPPAPRAGVCTFCDYRSVCGPDERRRSSEKEGQRLAPLEHLRRQP